jgi:hypothetical protein
MGKAMYELIKLTVSIFADCWMICMSSTPLPWMYRTRHGCLFKKMNLTNNSRYRIKAVTIHPKLGKWAIGFIP